MKRIYFMDGSECVAEVTPSIQAPPSGPSTKPFRYQIRTRWNYLILHDGADTLEAGKTRLVELLRDVLGMEPADGQTCSFVTGEYVKVVHIPGWTIDPNIAAELAGKSGAF